MAEDKKNHAVGLGEVKVSSMEDKSPFVGTDLAGGNLDKIREILFGTQLRNYEKRLARVEERLVKESTELKDEIRRRFDSLESYIKREVESLSDSLKLEQRERGEVVQDLSRELKDNTKILEKKFVQLDDQAIKIQRDLSQQILDKSKFLADDIQRKYEELLATLEQEVQELRSDKTDRATLASFFTEAAMRLNNEFKIPGND